MNWINSLQRTLRAPRRRPSWAPMTAVAAIAFLAATSPVLATTTQEQRVERRTFSAQPGATVNLENLAGAVTVEGTAGGDIEIVATINAEGGDVADAQTLLDALVIEFDESRGDVDVEIVFPVDRFDKYRYPQEGRGTYNTQTTYRDRRVRVTSRDDNDAVTLYVDVEIRVPAGVAVDIENDVGDVYATGVQGDFNADTGSGDVTARDGRGEVSADTGSGDVTVAGHQGDVNADTGSGDVHVEGVVGEVIADTGSGNVMLTDVQASRVEADTGSGDIEMQGVSGSIYADTGSGDITGRDLSGARTISADTGSGDVTLSGDLSQIEGIEIDTSSGDVELAMGSVPGMRITVETGNGSINVNLPGLNTLSSRRSYFRGEVGDGGAQVNIDTGSGDVRISSR